MKHLTPFFLILLIFSSLTFYQFASGYGTSTDAQAWRFSALNGASRIKYNNTNLSHMGTFITSARFGLEWRFNATGFSTMSNNQKFLTFMAECNASGPCGAGSTGDEFSPQDYLYISLHKNRQGQLGLNASIHVDAGTVCFSVQANHNVQDNDYHIYRLEYNGSGGATRAYAFIDDIPVGSGGGTCPATLTITTAFLTDRNGTSSGGTNALILDYARIFYPNNGTNILYDEFNTTPPNNWVVTSGYSTYTVSLEQIVGGGNIETGLDLMALDNNNNSRTTFANGESFKLNAFLFQVGTVFGGINGQDISFQRFDSSSWVIIGTARTGNVNNQDGIAEFPVVQFNKFIGETTQYRAVYSGQGNYSGSISDIVTITTTSIDQIPGRIPTALTLEPVRRVVNVDQGGVSESLEVNYEFGLFQNWRLRSILYQFQGEQYTPLQGQLIKFYIKKNNVGNYHNFANATTDSNGVGLTNWYSFDDTWSGQSNIKVLYSGTYTYMSSNSTSLIIAINSQTLRLTINLNNNVTNPGDRLTINGFLVRNSTISGANVSTAIPNEKVRIWINSTTIPFRLLSDSTYTNANGEYTLTFSVPALTGTYFVKANATVSLYNANVQSRVLGFGVRSISADAEPDLSPGVELDDIFIAPMDTCSNKLVCGFVFWIIFLAIFEIIFFMVASKLDFKGEFVGAGAIAIFLSSVPVAIAFTWLPITMIIIAVIPVAIMVWGAFRKVQGNN